jgi:hypothetical protein
MQSFKERQIDSLELQGNDSNTAACLELRTYNVFSTSWKPTTLTTPLQRSCTLTTQMRHLSPLDDGEAVVAPSSTRVTRLHTPHNIEDLESPLTGSHPRTRSTKDNT